MQVTARRWSSESRPTSVGASPRLSAMAGTHADVVELRHKPQSEQPKQSLWSRLVGGVLGFFRGVLGFFFPRLLDKPVDARSVGLPNPHRQTAQHGSPDRWIVNNCTTATLKTLLGFAPSEASRGLRLENDMTRMLHRFKQSGWSEAVAGELAPLLPNLTPEDARKLKATLSNRNLEMLFNDEAYTVKPMGMMAWLARHGVSTFPRDLGSEADRKAVKQALAQGKPVIVIDLESGRNGVGHATLYASRNGRLYCADPERGGWVDRLRLPAVPSSFAMVVENIGAFKRNA